MLYLRTTGLLLFAVAIQAQPPVGGLRGVVTDTMQRQTSNDRLIQLGTQLTF